jgi:site-specific DNA-adenine methylase
MFSGLVERMNEDVASPFNYTGSKFHLLDEIRKNLPEEHSGVFWDLFCGGGSVFVNLAKDFDVIYANDKIAELIEFYETMVVLKFSGLKLLLEMVKSEIFDKDSFVKVRDRFNEKRDVIDFFALCSSCTNNMMRFNKKFGFN